MSLKIKTSVDGSGFARGLDKMVEDASHFGATVSNKIAGNFSQSMMGVVPGLTGAIAGIFAADKLKAAVLDFAHKGEEIEFGSVKLNVDTGTYQRVRNVMEEVGLTADDAAIAMDALAEKITKIKENRDPTGEIQNAFASLGVSMDDLTKKSYQDVFFQIAKGLQGIQPTEQQMGALKELNRSLPQMLPAFGIGFDSRFAAHGNLSDKDLDASKSMNREARDLRATGRGFWDWLGTSSMKVVDVLAMGRDPKGFADYKKKLGDEDLADRLKGIKTEADQRLHAHERQEQHEKLLADKAFKLDHSKAAAIDHETAALKERNRIAAMTPEEKQLELKKEIAKLDWQLSNGTQSQATDAALAKSREELKGQLAEMRRMAEKPHHQAAIHAVHSLGNAAIGGIMLGHDRQQEAIAAAAVRTAAHLESIDRKTRSPERGRTGNREYP